MSTLRDRGEAELVGLIERSFSGGRALEVPIGDDGAVYDPKTTRQVAVADAMMEEVHFTRALCPPETIGRKLVAVNVSDIAAMGASPDIALLTMGLPGGLSWGWVESLIQGIADEARAHGVSVVGGDVTGSPGPIALSLSMLGRLDGPPVRRDGARVGDGVWLSRPLGAAALGLRLLRGGNGERDPEAVKAFLTPRPELEFGRVLAGACACHAMMDVSDGLAPDAARLARASGVCLEIELTAVPTVEAPDGLALALYGGEDYALLFTGPDEPPRAAIRIGRVVEGRGIRWLNEGVVSSPPSPTGFDHFE